MSIQSDATIPTSHPLCGTSFSTRTSQSFCLCCWLHWLHSITLEVLACRRNALAPSGSEFVMEAAAKFLLRYLLDLLQDAVLQGWNVCKFDPSQGGFQFGENPEITRRLVR